MPLFPRNPCIRDFKPLNVSSLQSAVLCVCSVCVCCVCGVCGCVCALMGAQSKGHDLRQYLSLLISASERASA